MEAVPTVCPAPGGHLLRLDPLRPVALLASGRCVESQHPWTHPGHPRSPEGRQDDGDVGQCWGPPELGGDEAAELRFRSPGTQASNGG